MPHPTAWGVKRCCNPSVFCPSVCPKRWWLHIPKNRPASAHRIASGEVWYRRLRLRLTRRAGTAGNVTSMTVLLRARMRGKSVYLFLLLLAVADTAVLYVSAFQLWIRDVAGLALLNVNTASCRTFMFLTLLFQHMAAWIVVLVTVDRFVAVWFPLKATSWCTVTRASVASATCCALVSLYRCAPPYIVHTLCRKKGSIKLLVITLSNLNRFSKFFHYRIL